VTGIGDPVFQCDDSGILMSLSTVPTAGSPQGKKSAMVFMIHGNALQFASHELYLWLGSTNQ
jgi:hypothetical protein